MGNDNSSTINLDPFKMLTLNVFSQAQCNPCLFTTSSSVAWATFRCTITDSIERLNPSCTKMSLVMLSRPDLMAVELTERVFLLIVVRYAAGLMQEVVSESTPVLDHRAQSLHKEAANKFAPVYFSHILLNARG